MNTATKALVAILLVVEAFLAVVGALFSFGMTAEYGDISATRAGAFADAWAAGILALAVALVGLFGIAAALAARRTWVTVVAVAMPVLMIGAVWATGPQALEQKRSNQYDAAPQCETGELGSGPGTDGANASQAAFDSIEHVGWFSSGGSSGVGGCDRAMVLIEPVDVIAHYETTLSENGWTIVHGDPEHLRAERGSMAFEVSGHRRDWIVWAGPITLEPDLDRDQVDGLG